MDFSERLNQAMKAQHIQAIEIAKKLKVSRGTVSQWVNGIAEPRGRNASKLAIMLKCNVAWLMHGDGNADTITEQGREQQLVAEVPLLSWDQAGRWLEIESQKYKVTQTYAHTASVGPRAFALRVVGDSMASVTGKSIPDGSIIIVDPDVQAEHGKVVVAMLEDSVAATLKQLIVDGGSRYLKPFNPIYPMMPLTENCRIKGVVKQVIQDF